MIISPQIEKFQQQTVKKYDLGCEVLYDKGNQVASQFGLTFSLPDFLREIYSKLEIDLVRYNGDNSWTLPMPGRFLIDPQGVIQNVSVDPDYTVRPEPTDIVEILKT